ncbi:MULTISPECIES: GLPGLI family protein [unclassified Empedobacter]|uniref:GLPGLI family protein n=1 Tax=unclassified Empedobacter TaxID=2643773 RepID=UPI0025BF419D|nr:MULTISPECIES: GLPGLI family protein [unclassified Empedobacter]
MKKLLTLIIIIIISSFAQAQFYEITYETQVQTHYNEEGLKWFEEAVGGDKLQIKKMIEMNQNPPKETFKFIYNESLSKSEYIRRINNNQDNESMISKVPMNMGGIVVNDYKLNQFSYEIDVYGKNYLVKDNLIPINITDTGKTKDIIGFKAYEATGKLNDIDIIVWYTKDIPYLYTPDIYTTSKGFILELHYKLNFDNSEMINSWLAIAKKESKKSPKISVPKKGIEVKANQTDAIYDEANKKMNELRNNSEGVDKK